MHVCVCVWGGGGQVRRRLLSIQHVCVCVCGGGGASSLSFALYAHDPYVAIKYFYLRGIKLIDGVIINFPCLSINWNSIVLQLFSSMLTFSCSPNRAIRK